MVQSTKHITLFFYIFRTPLILNKLPRYEISNYMEKLYDCKFNEQAVHSSSQEAQILSIVKNAKNKVLLTSSNYKTQIKTLNQIEDTHLRSEFRKYTVINPIITLIIAQNSEHKFGQYYKISVRYKTLCFYFLLFILYYIQSNSITVRSISRATFTSQSRDSGYCYC